MHIRHAGLVAAFVLAAAVPTQRAAGAGQDVQSVLRVMPADLPLTLVVGDFEAFDKSLTAFVNAVAPDSDFPGVLLNLKKELGISNWVDFSKPVGIAQESFDGADNSVIWATVPDFETKAKALPDAIEEEGVWHLAFTDRQDMYAKVAGAFVVASANKAALERATKGGGETLAASLKDRMHLFKDRHILLHINFEPLRAKATTTIAQFSPMIPMFAMMAGAQGGGDPAGLTAMLTAMVDGVTNFVEQVGYLDISVGVSAEAADITLATGFNDGAIKSYLAAQKPAGIKLLSEIEQRPYAIAMGWHVPGSASPFFDYVFDKMMATPPANPMGMPPNAGGEAAGKAKAEETKRAAKITRDLYRKVEGMNMMVAASPEGLTMIGNYVGSDTAGILDLVKKTMTAGSATMSAFNGGATYEASGSRKIGDVTVDEFVLKLDPTNPAAAQATKMFGENARLALGITNNRVRYCMGSEDDITRTFAGRVGKSLVSVKSVADVIAKLPSRRNAIILLDPMGVLAGLAPHLNLGPIDVKEPGTPIGISASLSGNPVRVDIHIPARAIGQVMEALTPEQPM